MNSAHLHLLLNHVPVLGTLSGMLLLAFAMIRRSQELTRVSLAVLVLAAVITIPVYWSGEPAEELVEHRPEVSERIIEQHEEAAEAAATALGILGALSLAGLVLFRQATGVPRRFAALTLALALVGTVLMIRTANLGGQVRHAEIRSATAGAPAGARERRHDDDDD